MNKGELLTQYLEDKGVRLNPHRQGFQQVSCFGPVHHRGDRLPSASVNLGTGRYRCFGCDLAGDVFDLYQVEHGVDFSVAFATLCGGQTTLREQEQETWL